jgi:hypothetical protein
VKFELAIFVWKICEKKEIWKKICEKKCKNANFLEKKSFLNLAKNCVLITLTDLISPFPHVPSQALVIPNPFTSALP